eukprot:TRINITY_DN59137_c0_g1_i1.p2 TRINITY_DN59137_c0_g1~~TRINITY_DN59137_c0_g1_i1.p2  ORF type:complete len:104 (+),score=28.18 TRINITY_DN59137_c0_g1_i1:99-410(+)
MLRSLVGSEMCIRDSNIDIAYIGGRSPLSLPTGLNSAGGVGGVEDESQQILPPRMVPMETSSMSRVVSDASSMDTCLLYTSDAADEEDSVDLGGRRIIKKKKN